MNLYDKHMLSPSSLWVKIIGVLTRNSGEKWKWNFSCIDSMLLLNMALICFSCCFWYILTQSLVLSGLGYPFFLSYDYSTLSSWPLVLCWAKCYHTSESCPRYVQVKSYRQFLLPIHCLTFCHSAGSYSFIPLYSLFRVDDEGIIMDLLRWVISYRLQFIIQENNLETPFQYLRDWMP